MIVAGKLWLAGDDAVAHLADQAAEHAEEHEGGLHHLNNIVQIIANITNLPWLIEWQAIVFSFLTMAFLIIILTSVARNLRKQPGPVQNFVEIAVSALDNFVQGVLGPAGRKYTPLIGTLFLYIIIMNLSGLIPLGFSATSSLNVTLSMALFVFVYVQIQGLQNLGILGYIRHFADLPEKPSGLQWCMAPLLFPLHIIGELAKPVSLSLRLFGNITGEDALIAIFVTLVTIGAISLPFHFFMYPIVLIGSCVQALVFAALTTIYILLMSKHEEEH